MESFLHSQTRFLNVHNDYYTVIIYIDYIFFPCFQFRYMRILINFLLCIVYICACISLWVISFYLWLVLVILFSKICYGFTPLWHWTSWHYTSWHIFKIQKFKFDNVNTWKAQVIFLSKPNFCNFFDFLATKSTQKSTSFTP